jgi:hypothetical protein
MEPPPAAAAAASSPVLVRALGGWFAFLAIVVATIGGRPGRAFAGDPSLSDANVLDNSGLRLHIESIATRISAFNQYGSGYQSKSGPILGPGSERLTVFEPQTEIIASQGPRITHRIWVPIDVISSASPNSLPKPVDIISGASRHNVAGTIEWTTIYKANPASLLTMNSGLHLESPFRSWNGGLGASRALADRNTVIAGNLVGIFDWFDRFSVSGRRNGRTERSSTLGSVSFTQVLTPTTVVNVNYGLTVQVGELGNTWNAVPLASGVRGPEILPSERVRHAIVGRMSQFLPWNGALRLYDRFYADDWGIVANSAEGQILQRLTPAIYVGALYRFHTQTGPFFFTTLAPVDAPLRVADSDLAPLQSQTLGAKIVGEVLVRGVARALHYELEYDRYVRTNDLRMDIVTCALALRF